MNTTIRDSRIHYPALDGLRGVASLLIIIYHNFGFIYDYVFFGWLGTDIFYVLSGFLITDILLSTVHKKDFLKNFYVRRILRVFPLYYLSLILFILILPSFNLSQININYYVDNQVWLWTFMQNWLYVFNPPSTESFLNHLWSLGVVEQFYLVWPLVILLLRNHKHILVFITILLILVVCLRIILWLNQIPDFAYYNLYTFTRIDGICIGCMTAILQRINYRLLNIVTPYIVFTLAGLNFIFYFINKQNNWQFPYLAMIGYTTFAVMIGLLVHDIVNNGTRIFTWIFRRKVLIFIGKISFASYIFHWPLYLSLRPYLKNWSNENFTMVNGDFFASIAATVLAYLLGFLSYRYFEMKFLTLKKYFI